MSRKTGILLIVAGTFLLVVPPAMLLAICLYMQHKDSPGGYVFHTNKIHFLLWLGLGLVLLAWGTRLVLKQR